MVARQLARHLPPPAASARVLDVGAGQGTQAVWLARRGFDVVAVEPDAAMREAFEAMRDGEPDDVRARLRVVAGALGSVADATGGATFDVVCCHGVLMYLDSAREAVVELADLVAPGGVLSLLARNADAMAMRPALRGRWADALSMLDAAEDPVPRYVNELGVSARADRLEELASYVAGRRMHLEAWYGVRVMTDGFPVDQPVPPDPGELATLLDVEERAGCTDPYRRVAALLHVVGRRAGVGAAP